MICKTGSKGWLQATYWPSEDGAYIYRTEANGWMEFLHKKFDN